MNAEIADGGVLAGAIEVDSVVVDALGNADINAIIFEHDMMPVGQVKRIVSRMQNGDAGGGEIGDAVKAQGDREAVFASRFELISVHRPLVIRQPVAIVGSAEEPDVLINDRSGISRPVSVDEERAVRLLFEKEATRR